MACDGEAGAVLQKSFPELRYFELEGYNIRYKKGIWNTLSLMLRLPVYFQIHQREKSVIADLHKQFQYDGIITDNRPSGFLKEIPSVYISHQLRVKAGMFTPMVSAAHKALFSKYSEVWVPDDSEQSLSGFLGRAQSKTCIKYIGWLSRLKPVSTTRKISWLAVLSGPEPLRSEWERELMQWREKLPEGGVIVRGKPLESTQVEGVVDYMDKSELSEAISSAEVVIARTGYSTLMDLATLGKKALLIPTPGQTEQEYLGEQLKENSFGWVVDKQGNTDYPSRIEEVMKLAVIDGKEGKANELPLDLFALFKSE